MRFITSVTKLIYLMRFITAVAISETTTSYKPIPAVGKIYGISGTLKIEKK